jgi:transcriptional repressor NrdR
MDQIQALAENVREDLTRLGREEVSSGEIGDQVMRHLRKLDRIAYIRFASVYRKFEEPEDFRRVLLEVKK